MKHRKTIFPLRPTALAAVILLIALGVAGRNNRWSREADMRKSDAIYMEALVQKQRGNADAYSELLTAAYQLNPADKYLGSEYGSVLVRGGAQSNDSLRVAHGVALIRDYAESPEGLGDYYTQMTAAQLSSFLGDDDYAMKVLRRVYLSNPDRPEAALSYSDKLAERPDSASLDAALAVLDTLETREGNSILLTGRRIHIYLMEGDTAAIVNEIQRQVKLQPTSTDVLVMGGDIFSNFNMPDSALAYYNRAIALDPENGIAYYSLANHYMNQGDSVGYGREMVKALELPDLAINIKTELIRDYVSRFYKDSSKHAELDSLFVRMLEMNPHEASLHGFYADYLAAIGRYPEAAEQVEYQLALDPGVAADRWSMLTSLYYSSKETEKAIDAATRGMHYYPDNADLPLQLSAAYTQQKQADKAIALLKPLVDKAEDAPRRSDLLTAIGDAFYADEKPDSAFTYYEQAIQANPGNYTAMNNCAYFLACQNQDLDRALSLIEMVIENKPDDPTSLDTYAWVLFKRASYDKALEAMDKALAGEDEPTAEMLEHAGDIYFMARKNQEAVEFWKKALELDPDNELLKRKVTHKTYFYE
ncbi:MAG: tetratricopeptide repeat protein [Muribaculaceae bacterium]|nr:tetratricopeptide repeat protein [Muribaculaceae bacterium]